MSGGRPSKAWWAWTSAWVIASATAFLAPAKRLLQATPGAGHLWPIPLDDSYIYFAYARATAHGAPMEWTLGGGYSSGATAPLYPLLLAPGVWLGFDGPALGAFAAVVALALVLDACLSLRRALGGRAGFVAAPLLVSVPLLGWSLWSGMETPLWLALAMRALAASAAAIRAPGHTRAGHQRRAGLWLAAMVVTRPESVGLAGALAVAMAHAGRALPAWGSLERGAGPTAITLVAQAWLNRRLTGEWLPAGAVRKALSTNPYSGPESQLIDAATHFVVLVHQGLVRALGGAAALVGVVLVARALWRRRTRRLALALVVGALASLAIVSTNSTAPYQNYRYAAPALVMWLAAAALGVPTGRRARLGVALAALLVLAPAPRFPRQVDHFRRAARNIAQQHGAVANRVAALDPPVRRLLVSDAGAVPFLARVPALDGLGLGGYRGLPFARASVHGQAAVAELIERLGPAERPDRMALYPSWWGDLTRDFGREIERVTIGDNVICGADTMVIYAADWRALDPPGTRMPGAVLDLDVADLADERSFGLRVEGGKGWVIGEKRKDELGTRYEGGRILDAGSSLRFDLPRDLPPGAAGLVWRTDASSQAREVTVSRSRRIGPGRWKAVRRHQVRPTKPKDAGAWHHERVLLDDVRGGERITITPSGGALRVFHLWLIRWGAP